ncbi:MAG: copper homeostasis protein CutC [Dysgonamonadaceae bacterium]|nr:copper homeostasis protein CutC [Dysgonamonadaceae bacterium]
MKRNIKLEVCVDSLNSAITAQKAGAHRLELCSGLSEGGLTPSYAFIREVRKLNICLNVLVRPRSGDFHYSNEEFEIMEEDIHVCGKIGCDGVVIGALNTDGTIDKERCERLIKVAHSYSMSVTFHRAFDRSNDLFEALEDVIELKCNRILTSGGYESAIEGNRVISRCMEQAANRIIIMPGSGITPQNVASLLEEKGLMEIHGTFRNSYPGEMQYRNKNFKNQSEYSGLYADSEQIKEILSLIDKNS